MYLLSMRYWIAAASDTRPMRPSSASTFAEAKTAVNLLHYSPPPSCVVSLRPLKQDRG